MVCKDFSAIPLLGAEVAMIFIHETHDCIKTAN